MLVRAVQGRFTVLRSRRVVLPALVVAIVAGSTLVTRAQAPSLRRPCDQTDQALCASLVDRSERLLDDDVLMPEARRELHEMLGYIRWVQPGLRRGAVDGR